MSNRKNWTEEDVIFLRNNHYKLTVPQMAEHLNITISSVTNKLKRLKLSYASSKDRLPAPPSKEQADDIAQSPIKKPKPKEKPPSPKPQVFPRTKVIELYEEALKQFHQINKHKQNDPQKQKAVDLFHEIFTKHTEEIDICNKARAYFNYLTRYDKADSSPKDIESKITEGIIHLQLDNIKEAYKIFRAIIKTEPHNPYNLYCLACTYAKDNDIKNALKSLKDCIKYDPVFKFVAINDKDLVTLYDNQEFEKITQVRH